jgi:hypothetical protein
MRRLGLGRMGGLMVSLVGSAGRVQTSGVLVKAF